MGCGKSKHAVVEHSISRKSSRAGSKRAKTPETTVERARKLDRNASTLAADEGGDAVCMKKSRAVADGNRVVGRVELKKQENLIEGEEQIHDATENAVDRKNSSVGSERGEVSEITVQEISELDTEIGSSMKEEGRNVDQSSGGDNSEGLADEDGIIDEIKEPEKRGNALETIEETSELDSGSSSLMKEEDKSADQDSSSANSQTVDENDIIESVESKEPIQETSKTDENTSSSTKGEDKNVDQDSNVDENDMVENIESKKSIEETSKHDENTSLIRKGRDENVDRDSSVDENDIVERLESKKPTEETSKTDENTSLITKGGQNVDQDSSVDENDMVESVEPKKPIENTSLLTKGGENVNQDSSVAGNDMVESIESKKPVDETSKTDENTSLLMEEESKIANQDSTVHENVIIESIESKKPAEETSKTDENTSLLMEEESKSDDYDSIIADETEDMEDENGVELKNQEMIIMIKREKNECKEEATGATLEDKKLADTAKEETENVMCQGISDTNMFGIKY
ncbi:hypothetical protein HRI_003254700 [Hibiscus trionum]|uniref:Uncharacterized protein n=1 Tax=Hibiscus trionum TaxID=183268 RepID=A0A9W7MD40_HIBTR|nr:hypothetical protein HRI_003254700 [Hibiscus trionum]